MVLIHTKERQERTNFRYWIPIIGSVGTGFSILFIKDSLARSCRQVMATHNVDSTSLFSSQDTLLNLFTHNHTHYMQKLDESYTRIRKHLVALIECRFCEFQPATTHRAGGACWSFFIHIVAIRSNSIELLALAFLRNVFVFFLKGEKIWKELVLKTAISKHAQFRYQAMTCEHMSQLKPQFRSNRAFNIFCQKKTQPQPHTHFVVNKGSRDKIGYERVPRQPQIMN